MIMIKTLNHKYETAIEFSLTRLKVKDLHD